MRTCRLVMGLVFIGLLGFACFPAPGAAGQLKLLSAHAGQRPPGLDRNWPEGFHVTPPRTFCRFRVPPQSKWNGGTIEFQTTGGRSIAQEPIRPGTIEKTVPANARILLTKPGVESRMFYIAMENPEVEKDIFYLTSGEFRQDFPHLQQSVVPPHAFRLRDLRKAVRRFDYELK